MVKRTLILTLAAIAALAAVPVRTMYNDAFAREREVRAELNVDEPAPAVLPRVRAVVARYEAVVRRYPASSYSDNAVGFGFPGGAGFGSRSETRTGWTAGGGVEWLVDKNWSLRAEYLYVDLGSMQVLVPTSNTPTFTQTMQVNADLTAQVARLGLNFRF